MIWTAVELAEITALKNQILNVAEAEWTSNTLVVIPVSYTHLTLPTKA